MKLPPPPQIELVVDKPHLMGVLRRPIVRIRRKYHIYIYLNIKIHIFDNTYFVRCRCVSYSSLCAFIFKL